MDQYLTRLMSIMEPPSKPRDCNVDWERLEGAVGMRYPAHFKEFVGVYGGSVWCDHVCPLYSTANSAAEVKRFIRTVKDNLTPLHDNMYTIKPFKRIEVPLFPDKGGLFPFMVDYSSSLYCWKAVSDNPDDWPTFCWMRGPIEVFERTTIAQMLVNWLMRRPPMRTLWGDLDDLPPGRV